MSCLSTARSLALGLVLSAPLAAFAGEEARPASGFYVAAGLGGDWIDDAPLTLFGNHPTSHWAAGWAGSAALGYRFAADWRAEIEGSGRADTVHSFNKNPWYGTQWDTSAMVNLYYDLPLGFALTPYVGAGAGLSHLSWGNNFRANLRGLPYIYDDSGTEFAWQGIVGVAWNVGRHLAVTLDGRYKGSAGNYRFRSSGPAASDISDFQYRTRSLFAGLRYSF